MRSAFSKVDCKGHIGSPGLVAKGGQLTLWRACVLAFAATAATLWLRMAMDGPLDGRPTLVMFMVPIMLGAYVGGLRVGLLTTLLSILGACFSFRTSAVTSGGDMEQGVRKGDAQAATDAAHRPKSGARSIGARRLGEICDEMESAGKRSELGRLDELLSLFQVELAAVFRFLESRQATTR